MVIVLLLTAAPLAAKEAGDYQAGLGPRSRALIQSMQESSRAGDFARGLKAFAATAGKKPAEQPVLVLFVAANLYFQAGDYAAAGPLYRTILKREPEFFVVYENLGQAEFMAGNYPAAAASLQKAAAFLPEKADRLFYQAAAALLYAEKPAGARDLLTRLVASRPRPPVSWLKALLQAHWRLKENQAALRVAERLVDQEPDQLENWRICAQLRMGAGDYRGALSAWKVVQSAGALKDDEYRLLAGIYQQLRLPAPAAVAWQAYLQRISPTTEDLENMVSLYVAAGKIEAALNALETLAPRLGAQEAAWRRAKLLYRSGRYREALPIFLQLKKLAAEDGYQFLLAGYCAWNLNDFQAAARAWRKAAAYPAWQERAQSLSRRLEPWLKAAETSAANPSSLQPGRRSTEGA